jgi:peptidoglycan hydrolase CwlO-like protein
MSKTKGKVIEELVSLILMQEKQIKRLKEKIRQAKRHIEVYEEYIKEEDKHGY